jgi:hypothetical protein
MGLTPAQNVPSRIGIGQSTPCGRMSAIASRQGPANAILMCKLLAKNRRLLIALWPNGLLLHDRWPQPEPSSYGFAATASMSGLSTRLCGDRNARPLLHVCNTSRTAACAWHVRKSSIDRQLQCKQRFWPIRLTSGAGRMHWPQSNPAKSRPNAL